MNSSDVKLDAINGYLKRFYDVFNKSPFMLGKPNELNALLYYADHLSYIARYGEDFPQELSWVTFLSERNYVRGDHDLLADAIKSTSDLKLLYDLRSEYAEWFFSKTGREFAERQLSDQ